MLGMEPTTLTIIESQSVPAGTETSVISSLVVEIICPSCGEICHGNRPPKPIKNQEYTVSDGACFHCQAQNTIKRFQNDSLQVSHVSSILDSNRVSAPLIEPRIALIGLGADLPPNLDLDDIAKRASMLQEKFDFRHEDTLNRLGEPDIDPETYSVRKLLSSLFTFPESTYVIGITNKRIERKGFSMEILEQNRGIKAVLSLNEFVSGNNISSISLQKYVTMKLVTILVFVTYVLGLIRQNRIDADELDLLLTKVGESSLDLHHNEVKDCIFDVSPNRKQGTHNCRLCTSCMGKLENSGAGISSLTAFDRLMRDVRKPTIRGSVTSILHQPMLSFLFGGLIISALVNLGTSLIPADKQEAVFLGLLACSVMMVFGQYMVDWRKSL